MPIKGSSFKQLSKEDRTHIERWARAKKSKSEIAKLLGVHRSTICRQLNNNDNLEVVNMRGGFAKQYFADRAHERYLSNKAKCGANCKAFSHKDLLRLVCEKFIKNKWPPDVTIQFAKNNHMFENYFTSRSVYNWIKDGIITIKDTHLRHGLRNGKRRKNHMNKTKLGKSIELRPEAVNTRQEFGHWEADCILDEYHNAILVFEERMTRHFEMRKLDRLNSHTVFSQLSEWIHQYKDAVKTITFDNGSEFARAHELSVETYFAHPYSPHEKGGIENLNGRLRWDIPKGRSLTRYTHEMLGEIRDNINTTPRRILNYETPKEQFELFLKNAILSQTHPHSLCCN